MLSSILFQTKQKFYFLLFSFFKAPIIPKITPIIKNTMELDTKKDLKEIFNKEKSIITANENRPIEIKNRANTSTQFSISKKLFSVSVFILL